MSLQLKHLNLVTALSHYWVSKDQTKIVMFLIILITNHIKQECAPEGYAEFVIFKAIWNINFIFRNQ